jgi:hypothetical protein
MYKYNSLAISKLKDCSLLQLSCNLRGMKFTLGYYSYTNRYDKLKKSHDRADNPL